MMSVVVGEMGTGPREALATLLCRSQSVHSAAHAMSIDTVSMVLAWVGSNHPDVLRARELGCTRDGEELTPESDTWMVMEITAMILAEHRHISHHQALSQITEAQQAIEDVALHDAYRDGKLSWTQRNVILRAHQRLAARAATLENVDGTTPGSSEVGVAELGQPVLTGAALDAARAELTRSALAVIETKAPTPAVLTKHCTAVIRRLTPEHVPVEVTVRDARRHVSMQACDTPGLGEDTGAGDTAHLTAFLPLDVATKFDRWLNSAADTAAAHSAAAGVTDKRTHQQRRCDAFTDVVVTAMRDGVPALSDPREPADPADRNPVTNIRTHRPASSTTVQVTISARTLLGLDDEPAEVAGLGEVPAHVGRALAVDGEWRRILTDPITRETLDVSANVYRPGAALKRFVQARDRTCTTPGCLVPAIDCDLDHQIPFDEGGKTVAKNLHASCRRHHRAKTLYVFEDRDAHRRRRTSGTTGWPDGTPPF